MGTRPKRTKNCAGCGRVFRTRGETLYCSSRCHEDGAKRARAAVRPPAPPSPWELAELASWPAVELRGNQVALEVRELVGNDPAPEVNATGERLWEVTAVLHMLNPGPDLLVPLLVPASVWTALVERAQLASEARIEAAARETGCPRLEDGDDQGDAAEEGDELSAPAE